MFVCIISKPFDLDQMRMGWINNNLAGKRIFIKQFVVALIDLILAILL